MYITKREREILDKMMYLVFKEFNKSKSTFLQDNEISFGEVLRFDNKIIKNRK